MGEGSALRAVSVDFATYAVVNRTLDDRCVIRGVYDPQSRTRLTDRVTRPLHRLNHGLAMRPGRELNVPRAPVYRGMKDVRRFGRGVSGAAHLDKSPGVDVG